jgi:hypothetical protein
MDTIKAVASEFEKYIYPDTYTPVYQVLSGVLIGLFFGAYHKAFIWSLVSYCLFEYLLVISTRKRQYLYDWRYRILAIMGSILGIIISKAIWGQSEPFWNFLIVSKHQRSSMN